MSFEVCRGRSSARRLQNRDARTVPSDAPRRRRRLREQPLCYNAYNRDIH